MGLLPDLSPQGTITIGVFVGLLSTGLQAIGLTLQRKSHLLEDLKHPLDVRRPPYKRRRWQFGMFMFVSANIFGSGIQITTLPLPVLSTLQASGLVFNTIFATIVLAEPFTRFSLLGTLLVCVGALLIATFGAISEPSHSLDQLLQLLARRPFLVWMAVTMVVVAGTLVGMRVMRYLSVTTTTASAGRGHHTPADSFRSPRTKLGRGLLYGLISGILSAHALLIAKSAVELLVRSIVYGSNQFNRWQSWAIVFGLISLASVQLYFMHCGLKLCSTSVLYPFVFCVYNVIAILDGLIYFRQTSKLPASHALFITLGTAILLGGVLCLSWRLDEHENTMASTTTTSTTAVAPTVLRARDEECPRTPEPDERQPLLPQLPIQPQTQLPQAPLMETAQIWAELDERAVAPTSAASAGRSPALLWLKGGAGRQHRDRTGGCHRDGTDAADGRTPLRRASMPLVRESKRGRGVISPMGYGTVGHGDGSSTEHK